VRREPARAQAAGESLLRDPTTGETWMLQPAGDTWQWVAMPGGAVDTAGRDADAAEDFEPRKAAGASPGMRQGPMLVKTPRQLLAEAGNRRDPAVRTDAIAALAKAAFGGEPSYLALYRDALRDPDGGVRLAAVRALGLHGRTEDVARLQPMTRSTNSQMRIAAERAMQSIELRRE